MSPIYMIAGDKGDGKSLFSMALLDYLTNHDNDCLLIDSDTLNPDVYNVYSKEVPSIILDLNKPDGWIKIVDICEHNYGKPIVINGTASGIEGVEQYSKTLLNCLFALGRHLVTFWIISPDTHTLETLDRYKKVVGRRIVHIIRNQKYENSSILLCKQDSRYQEFRRNGRIMYLPELDEEEHDYFIEENLTIKKCIDNLQKNSSLFSKMYSWRIDAKDYIFSDADYRIKDIINTDGKSFYKTFTRRLADEIEERLKGERREDTWNYLFASSNALQVDLWDSEDIGDLLAEGKVSIEDLAAAVANGEDLDEDDRLRLERSLEPETEEEYQERLQREYIDGGNPDGFIPTAWDIRSRAANEYIDGGNPDNFIPTEDEIRLRAGTYIIPF